MKLTATIFKTRLLVISATVVLFGCFGGAKSKPAKFNRDSKVVLEELRQLGSFEDAKISWSARTFDDKTAHHLRIQLLNGAIPDDDSTEYEIGKQAMQKLLAAIDNDEDYENFVVIFVTRSKNGAITVGAERPYEYKLSELQ